MELPRRENQRWKKTPYGKKHSRANARAEWANHLSNHVQVPAFLCRSDTPRTRVDYHRRTDLPRQFGGCQEALGFTGKNASLDLLATAIAQIGEIIVITNTSATRSSTCKPAFSRMTGHSAEDSVSKVPARIPLRSHVNTDNPATIEDQPNCISQ